MIGSRVFRAAVAAASLCAAGGAAATPSSVFRTPATTDVQPAWVPHLGHDTYFGEAGALQIDTGLTVGVLDTRLVALEVGGDLYFPTRTPAGQRGTLDFAQVNAKLTVRPGGEPDGLALSFGVSNLGFVQDVSNYDVLYGVVGFSSRAGRWGVGAYRGAGSAYLWSRMADEGGRSGLLLSWVSRPVDVGRPGLQAIRFLVDAAVGKNWLGGAGAAVALQLTPAIALKTGPVIVADFVLYQNSGLPVWFWSVQLDADVDLRPRSPSPPPSP